MKTITEPHGRPAGLARAPDEGPRRRCLGLGLAAPALHAAVGCDLNDPDRDVKRLFPGSTGYKTLYVSISKKGGDGPPQENRGPAGRLVRRAFRDGRRPLHDVPNAHRARTLARLHPRRKPEGDYGGLQVFLALDLKGVIKGFYFQKLTAKAAKAFRDPAFGSQFVGLSLEDFYKYDVASGHEQPPGPISRIKNPDPASEKDFRAALRATKKNLVLVDEFLLGNPYLKFFRG